MPFRSLAAGGRRLIGAAMQHWNPPSCNRHCRLYGLGTPKSGTHSITKMFLAPIRAEHEIEYQALARKIVDAANGRISRDRLNRWLHKRDRRIQLDVDSSTLNFFILDHLVPDFADARFLLTIRDCYSWLNSMANHALRYPQKKWREFRDFRFRPDLHVHAPEERAFKDAGLHTVEGYLAYWARHNQESVDRIPPERLLIVRTDRISDEAFHIADFAGVAREYVDRGRTHEFQNPARRNLLAEVDRDFLEDKVQKHCRALMTRFFPEIDSLDAAKL